MDEVDAVAEAWASIDGKLDLYNKCIEDAMKEEELGYWGGYLADAAEMVRRLKSRGFKIVPVKEGE